MCWAEQIVSSADFSVVQDTETELSSLSPHWGVLKRYCLVAAVHAKLQQCIYYPLVVLDSARYSILQGCVFIRMWRSFFVSIFSSRVSFRRPRCLCTDSFPEGVSHFSCGLFVGSSLVRFMNSGVL